MKKLIGVIGIIFLAHCANLYFKKQPPKVYGVKIVDTEGNMHRYPLLPNRMNDYQYCYIHEHAEKIYVHYRPKHQNTFKVSHDVIEGCECKKCENKWKKSLTRIGFYSYLKG